MICKLCGSLCQSLTQGLCLECFDDCEKEIESIYESHEREKELATLKEEWEETKGDIERDERV